MPKVSVIVPVYNQEPVLTKCIDSILCQSLSDLEIILVNDGSTDGSLKICRLYEERDHRIQVIDQPNSGVAAARNAGLSAASGQYAGFVDSDDWIEPDMFRRLVEAADHSSAEVGLCDYFTDKGRASYPVHLGIKQTVLSDAEIFSKLVQNMVAADGRIPGQTPVKGACFRLLVRKDLIDEFKLRFPEDIRYMEDLIFTVHVLTRTERVSIIPVPLYHYNISLTSVSKKYIPSLFELLLRITDELLILFRETGSEALIRPRIRYRYVFSGVRAISNEAHPGNHKKYKEKLNAIRSICSNPDLQEALDHSEFVSPSLTRRLTYWAMRHKKSGILYALYRLNYRLFKLRKRESFIPS